MRCLFFVALSVIGFADPAHGRVLHRADNGFVIENTVMVPNTATQAWLGLTEHVGEWWPADHTWFGTSKNLSMDARAGGCFCEIDGARQAEHMRITHVAPGQLLRMLGGLGPLQGMGLQGALDWRFDSQEDGTRITLRYQLGGYSPSPLGELIDVIDQVQAQQLGGLATYLRAQR